MSYENEETLREFVEESREHLSAIEPDLLAMDQQGDAVAREAIHRVFRAIHSTKGGASFLSFQALNRVAHRMESVLDRLRAGSLGVTPEVVDVLLRGVDVLRAMIDDIGHSEDLPCERELGDLDVLLATAEPEGAVGASTGNDGARSEGPGAGKARGGPLGPVPAPQVRTREPAAELPSSVIPEMDTAVVLQVFGVSEQQLAQPLSRGMRLYQLHLDPRSASERAALETTIGGVGILLGTRESTVGRGSRVLCASVLEPQMLAAALGIGVESLERVETARLRERLRANATVNGDEAPRAAQAPQAPRPASGGDSPAPARATEETLRVRVALLNRLMDTAGELVLARNQLLLALRDDARGIPGLVSILQNVDRVTTQLQEGIMQTRMQPVGALFGRYPRVIRDLARQLGKQAVLSTEGEDVELDKAIIEALVDPLTHILRNCVDHAIEPPRERERLGKPASGQIALRAFQEGGYVNILVSDDGRGVDRDKVLAWAVKHGSLSSAEAAELGHGDLTPLLLMPGMSTASGVSELSGRGVGLDVVRANVERLGGRVEIESESGVGTDVMLRMPLTLAIISSLVVSAGGRRFAVAQSAIEELVWVPAAQIRERVEVVQESPVLRRRGRLLPLVRLAELLGVQRCFVDPETGEPREDRRRAIADERREPLPPGVGRAHWSSDYNVVVVRDGSNRYGIIVDELLETEDIVVRPLPRLLDGTRCFSGSTILGDGRVTMILDPGGISRQARLAFAKVAREEESRSQGDRAASAAAAMQGRSVVLFDNAPGERFAIPQEQILRFERIVPENLERMAEREYVKYRGGGLRIIRLSEVFPVSSIPEGALELFIIIPKNAAGADARAPAAGILAWSIVDARRVEVSLGEALFPGPGLLGAALVDDCLTTFLDPCRMLSSVEVSAKVRP